ncbi:hypothetical protein ISG29_13460 [Nocardioides sp. CBS4Y-1]|uniref:Uncharacterized protein n=1 Tax=Nocardioides acrostichi TaxID=2784339 RepID=A0A930YDQ7_9ACTN|nr:hypothetical protein [Nocardioides acrostichi]
MGEDSGLTVDENPARGDPRPVAASNGAEPMVRSGANPHALGRADLPDQVWVEDVQQRLEVAVAGRGEESVDDPSLLVQPAGRDRVW